MQAPDQRQPAQDTVPQSLYRLGELARNLWWSWTPTARQLFESIDPTLWFLTHHNPVQLLSSVKPERLTTLASDTNIYSGGLGILAGDHCKESSDLGIPLVGIGFMYPQGYFKQRINPEGWQEATYAPFNRHDSPIQQAMTPAGVPCSIKVEIGHRQVTVLVWQVRTGRMSLFLIDTDVPENTPEDRALSARLYGGDQETRLCQEFLLGIGGVRVLRALGINPAVWHCNEGHSAFLTVERIREFVTAGHGHAEASELVRQSTVFTTHTPVPAGHDIFPFHLMDRYFTNYWSQLGLSREEFLGLGETPDSTGHGFNMTALAMRLSAHVNGVSREHGRVSRHMWQHLWPGLAEDLVPIRHLTNGIHAPTWISPEANSLYAKYVSTEWAERIDDPTIWQRVTDLPDHELWSVRQTSRRKLMRFIRERARDGWIRGHLQPMQAIARGTLLDPEALTIGFARRFATYKRATLLFRDLERLKQLLHNRWRPVQIVFAGKAHPADEPGRYFIHEVLSFCNDHKIGGHVAFLEDYDMHMAKYLVQGVDIWLNTPRAPLEASGTSGQKAALNGVINLSVLDGWWQEGYNGANGWGIQPLPDESDTQAQDAHDAEQLFRLLEQEVVPLFYQRDLDGIPRGWLHIVKESIKTIAPRFCTKRMVKEYMRQLYAPATARTPNKW
ncbi:MAG: glgP [Nitrospira sp.]|nr:glgP [Nitrospira sp.]